MKNSILLKFLIANGSIQNIVGSLMEESTQINKAYIDGYLFYQNLIEYIQRKPSFVNCENILEPSLQKHSMNILPFFYDHFLRLNWESFSNESFDFFVQNLNKTLSENHSYIPNKQKKLFYLAFNQNWFDSLKSIGGMHFIMRQHRKYFTLKGNLDKSVYCLIENYSLYQECFHELMFDLNEITNFSKYQLERKVYS